MNQSEESTVEDDGQMPEAVTITMFAHWNCPGCDRENAFRLDGAFPIHLTCSQCGKKVRTLENM